MARFRIFNPTTKKKESMSDTQIAAKTKKSAQWFRDSIAGVQKSSRPTRASQIAQRQLATSQLTQAQKKAQKGAKKGDKYLNSNTTLSDPEFKRNVIVTKQPLPGNLLMYVYDAKHKKTLPYFDKFPMVMVLDMYPDGFAGINFHYMNPLLRATMFEIMLTLQKERSHRGKKEGYIDASYQILKATKMNKVLGATYKRYLYNHVRSPFAKVLEPAWEEAIFLPVAQFTGATKREVWSDTKTKIR